VFFVIHLSKKLDKNSEEDKKQAESLRSYLENKLKELREDTAKALEEHGRRLSYMELEYVRRETFYRELGGWRDDINRILDQVSELRKSAVELWRDRAK